MTAEDLYTEMKNALDYFGLRFNGKDRMHVEFGEGFVVFSHENLKITINTTDEHDDSEGP